MERLARYLAEHKLTQKAFAEVMNVSQPTVWGWVSGNSAPTVSMLKALADQTGLTTDELLGRRPRRSKAA